MKRIRIYTIVLSMVFAVSCNEDFLNTQPLDKISSDATWADGQLSEAFIFNVYSFLGYGGFEEQSLAAYTDEAMFTHTGRNIETFNEGSETPTNVAWISDTYGWDKMYSAIRQTNVALENLPEATFGDDELKERLMGEAHFLRAYYYQQLLRFYGGVPIINKSYGLDEDYNVARNTYQECVDFIIEDLDAAANMLDSKTETPGRANKLSAMALKARVLLYAASDLHDATTATANSSDLSSYGNIDLVAYTSGDRRARWEAAKAASKAVVDATSGYKFGLTSPVSAEEGEANYNAIAMAGGSSVADAGGAADLIFYRTLSADYTAEDNWPLGGLHVGINNGPNGYHNWAGNTPIQQLVDDYEMMDGSSFDWDNPEHAASPYENRDPRFYATILYDGADWKPRPSDVAALDPVDQIQTGSYPSGAGLDTRQSQIEDWNGTRTNYYTRKFIDPDPGLPDNQSNSQLVPWPFIRYTEVVFNYIEACLELGEEGEALPWLNQIRYRAGMPEVTETGDALIDVYRNERRIELQYEEHRYHDARRWMIAPETLGRGIKMIKVTATLKAGATAHSPYRYDTDVYDYTYEVADNTENETRVWVDKMYYRPITRDEINRNNLLVQNPGY